MKTLVLIIFTSFILLFSGEAWAEEMVSVKLKNYLGDTQKLSLRLKGNYLTFNQTLNIKEGVNYTLKLKRGKLFLYYGRTKTELDSPFILFPSTYDENHLLSINKRSYMGAIEFNIEKKYIRPVNQLLLEDYLKGVVPFEVFPSWNIEALKAQTLAARTYTITHKNTQLDDTIHFQVYGGYNHFHNAKKAVVETAGEIITFKNRPINAFYSASNGGMTESNKNVWGGNPSPYFPIKQDPFDPIQPWSFSLRKTQIDWDGLNPLNGWNKLKEKDGEITTSIKKWLNQNGYPGEIKVLSIPFFEIDKVKNKSNRSIKGSIQIEFMRRLIDGTILFEKISLHHVELNRIRPIIGGVHFRSYLIGSFESNPTLYKVTGKGNGHGVGMSQWGANEIANKGGTYKKIIRYYYPGTQVKENP